MSVCKAILFDLDGTLLPLDMEEFLPKYMLALAEKVELEPRLLSQELVASTMKMIANDGKATNSEVFAQDFFPKFSREQKELEALIELFYEEDFPLLGTGIEAAPAARNAVEAAFAITPKVVIATNSVFPREAIVERMRWANVHDFPYTLITCYQEMSSAKPSLAYYREILAKIGVEPEEAWMIGNDVEEDLVAGALGVKTFLVEDFLIHREPGPINCQWQGSLEECAKLLEDYAREARINGSVSCAGGTL